MYGNGCSILIMMVSEVCLGKELEKRQADSSLSSSNVGTGKKFESCFAPGRHCPTKYENYKSSRNGIVCKAPIGGMSDRNGGGNYCLVHNLPFRVTKNLHPFSLYRSKKFHVFETLRKF